MIPDRPPIVSLGTGVISELLRHGTYAPTRGSENKTDKYFINILEGNKLGRKINRQERVGENIISAVESG